MNKKQTILNREAVINILQRLSSDSHMTLAPAVIMQQAADELTDICMDYQSGHVNVASSELDRFASLRPTDSQIRCALLTLLDQKKADGIHYLFSSSRQYLSVFKVLDFLGIMSSDYGCYARMEAYICQLFAGNATPRVLCNQDALSKKCAVKPYTLPLADWEPVRSTKALRNYWPLAIQFLMYLQAECAELGAELSRNNRT